MSSNSITIELPQNLKTFLNKKCAQLKIDPADYFVTVMQEHANQSDSNIQKILFSELKSPSDRVIDTLSGDDKIVITCGDFYIADELKNPSTDSLTKVLSKAKCLITGIVIKHNNELIVLRTGYSIIPVATSRLSSTFYIADKETSTPYGTVYIWYDDGRIIVADNKSKVLMPGEASFNYATGEPIVQPTYPEKYDLYGIEMTLAFVF